MWQKSNKIENVLFNKFVSLVFNCHKKTLLNFPDDKINLFNHINRFLKKKITI